MLRITKTESSVGGSVLRVEGKLVGPWVNELRSYCSIVRGTRNPLKLEMTEVSFVDRAGIALLRDLEESGIGLVGCSAFITEELNR
jgi:anti-anti-sigma regulatory factor